MERLKDILAPIVALLALIALAVFIVFMTGMLTEQETQWTRAVYLFAGVEAIAFAAAGFFFGNEVQRERAEKAEKRTDQAQQQASQAQQQASQAQQQAVETKAKGEALRTQLDVKAQSYNRRTQTYGSLGADQAASVTQADIEELAVFAKQLFP